jgi:ATP-dependent protease ClpP protease subunit
MSEHCLIFSATEIDHRVVNTMVSYLTELAITGCTKLTMAISSPGGNVVAGVTIYNALMSMPFEIDTHNFGNVDSIANVIFLAGKRRYANTTATFMFHGVGFNGNANERLEEKNILEKLDVIRAEHKRIAGLIASRSTLQERACLRLFRQQRTRSAGWAKANGLIEDVKDFVVPAGATLKYLV